MPPPKAPPLPKPAPPPTTASVRKLVVSSGRIDAPQRIGIYGPGGSGKSSLAAALKDVGKTPLFLDLDDGSRELDVDRIHIQAWEELLQATSDESLWASHDTAVVDSLTRAEQLAVIWTLANIKNDKGQTVNSIEGYGYGKGMVYVYETFAPLIGRLEHLKNQGKNVVVVMHDCTATVPNPAGDDFIRYEPRLQSPNSGKNSIRHYVKEWLDHLFFLGYDVSVSRDGLAQGSGTRTIYCQEMPTYWAKSRRIENVVPFDKGSSELWRQLFGV